MKISQMRYFVEVCKYENITTASKNLHVSQPTITIAIKDLEQEFGVNLFHRVKQRIHMTSEGEYLFSKLNNMLELYDELVEEMKDLGHKRNHINIGVPPMMGAFLFPKILSKFIKVHPDIDIEIIEYGTKELHRLLLDDLIDLSLMTENQARPEKILFKPIMQTHYQLYVPVGHPLIGQAPVNFKALAKENLILFNKGFNINEVITDKFKDLQLKPKILLQTGQVQNVKKLIEEGVGIGFLIPECVSAKDNIVPVELKTPIKTTVGLEWKKDRTLYSDEANFVKFITNNF